VIAREPPYRLRGRARPSRRRAIARAAFVLLLGGACFAVGLALGGAVEENPKPGGRVTYVRTLRPVSLAPAPRTVTVTVTDPTTATEGS
jgi:hypothetical protein